MATVPLSEWMNLKQQANKNALGVSEWTRTFLEPLNQQVESTAQAYQASANYDISQAYQNYKKQQLAVMGSNLTAGKKEDYSTSLSSAFKQSAFQTKQQLASNLSDLGTQYNKALSSEYASLEKYATQMQELEEAVFTRAGVNRTQAEQAGWYDFDPETNQYSINDVGRANISRVLYDVMKDESGSARTFGDWLYDYNPDLYNFYATNRADVNEILAGENRSLSKYDKDKYNTAVSGTAAIRGGVIKTSDTEKTVGAPTETVKDADLLSKLNTAYGNITSGEDLITYQGQRYVRLDNGGFAKVIESKNLFGTEETIPGNTIYARSYDITEITGKVASKGSIYRDPKTGTYYIVRYNKRGKVIGYEYKPDKIMTNITDSKKQ